MIKKILLCGFYGAYNLGDELMLDTLLDKISSLNDNVSITVLLCNDDLKKYDNYKEYSCIFMPTKVEEYKDIVRRYDTLIFGGGALIDDKDYTANKVSLCGLLIDLSTCFIDSKKDVICMSLSSNSEISDDSFIEKLDYVIANSKYFSLRDTYSYNTLIKSGIKNYNAIDICDDIVISNLKFKRKIKAKKEKVINIGIILFFNGIDMELIEKIILNIIKIFDNMKKKYRINLIPFYYYREFDYKQYHEVLKKFQNNNLNLLDYPYNFEKLQEVLSNQNIIFSMRYHGVLMGMFLNKSVVEIVYKNHRHYYNKMEYLKKYYRNVKSFDFSEMSTDEFFLDRKQTKKLFKKMSKIKSKYYIYRANKKIVKILEEI